METVFKPTEVYFLEMHERPGPILMDSPAFSARPCNQPISAAFYLELYSGVGKQWNWLDRILISPKELDEKINAGNVHIYTFHWQENLAGFAELVEETDYVEILYFGLLPEFTGKGLGPNILKWTIQQAWSFDRQWIQLNTCSLDHPGALGVYKKAGFQEVRREMQERRVRAEI